MTSNPGQSDLGPSVLSEGELLPCPFCGGAAERIDIEDGDNAGGSCISCTVCQASGNVEFEFKENFVSNWNRRALATRSPSPAVPEEEIAQALRVDSAEARARLPEFIDQVRIEHQPIVIYRYGKPVAILSAVTPNNSPPRD